MSVKFYGVNLQKGDIQLYSQGIPPEVTNMAVGNECILHPTNMFALAIMADSDPTHRSCLDIKSLMTVGLGYKFTNKKAKKSKAFQEFIETPNLSPFRTFQDLLDSLAFDYMTFGNGYLEFASVGKSNHALYHMIARDMYIKPKKIGGAIVSGLVESYHQIARGTGNEGISFRALERNEKLKNAQHYVAHMYQYTPASSYYGLPSYLAATPNISENVLIRQHGIRFFSNSARPDMALLISNGDVSPEEVTKIQEQFSSQHKGIDNSHRLFIMSIEGEHSNLELKEISKSLDGEFLKEGDKNRDEIARIHGVPPKVLGISSAGSLGSGSETIGALKNFIETNINPLQSKFENFVNRVCMIMFGFNPGIKFYKIDLTNKKDDAIIHTMLSKIIDINGMPAMTTTEVREKWDLPEEPEGALMLKPQKKESIDKVDAAGKPKAGVKLDQQDKIETLDEENPKPKPD